MRFLFLITHYYPHVFGAELFAQKLAESLVGAGHTVDIVTGRWEEAWSIKEKVNGVNVYRVNSLKIRFLQTLLFVLPQLKLARQLDRQHPYDYVHAHIYPSLLNGFKVSQKAVSVVTIQGGDLGDYPEIYGPFASIAKRLIGNALKKYHHIHVVSKDLQQQVIKLAGSTAIIVPNGIEAKTVFKPNRKLFGLKTTHIAFSPSRLTDKNNLAAVIKAVKKLRLQKIDIGLAIAGSGHLEASLSELINKLRLNGTVKLLGPVNHNQALQLIKSADMVVRPSKQEGFGIALLEAMSLKRPVIATRKGGLADFVSNDTAFVCATSVASIMAAIKNCIKADEIRRHKVTKAYLLSKNYTWDKITSRFKEEIYGLK